MLFNPKPQPLPPLPPEPLEAAEPIQTDQLRLSQSLIRAIEQETMCPRFYKEYHWLQIHQFPTTQAQAIGQYFEWLAINNKPRGGKVIVPDTTGRGQKSADTIRIEKQAARVVTLFERYDMHVVYPEGQDAPGVTLQMPVPDYPDIIFEGSFDMIAESHKEPDILTITDLKATKALHSRFSIKGKAGWGDFFNMDHLQAFSYLWLARTRWPNRYWRFRYAVFSYDVGSDYQLFEVEMTSMDLQELKQRVSFAAAKLAEWAADDFEPKGHPDCCSRCIHKRECPACQLVKPITTFKRY